MAFTGGCQATVDVFEYLAPQLAAAVTGGNATLGQGGAMAGAGHFALTLRGNVSQAAGIGQDSYHSSATIQKALPSTSGPFRISQGVRRMSWFGDLSMNVLLAKLVAEIGGVSGGTIETYNSFAGKSPDALRLYGSLGVRVGI